MISNRINKNRIHHVRDAVFFCQSLCKRCEVPLFLLKRSILTVCRLQSKDQLTPVDNLADSSQQTC